DGNDADFLPTRIPADQTMRQMFAFRSLAGFRTLDAMFLHEHPLIAAVFERFDKFISRIGLIRQRHFRGGKSTHSAKRFDAEDGGKMMLPGRDVQPVILHRRRGSDGMAPGTSQPFDRSPVARFASNSL